MAAGAVLLAALAGFLLLVLREDGASRFGSYHDDTLYWNVAGAIAEGQGAVLPNLPDEPSLTKYPLLYPHFLSLIWTPLSENSAGIAVAIAFSTAFAIWALIISFLQFRTWRNVGELQAASCVGLCALSGVLLASSASVLSETLFFALAATALWLAELEHRRSWIGAAVFAGLAMLTRSIGIAVIGGIAASYLLRKRYSAAIGFGLLTAPFAAVGVLAKLSSSARPAGEAAGFQQTWLYYNDYVGFWLTSMPDLATLSGLLKVNLLETLRTPAGLTLGDAPPGPVGLTIWVTLTVAIIAGLYRQVASDRLRAYHCALALHVPFTLLWNFEIADRLLLLFLPLFWMGLWIELRHAATGFFHGLKAGRPTADRVISAICLAAMFFGAGWWTLRTVTGLTAPRAASVRQVDRYAALIAWLRANAAPQDRLVAIDDGFLYAHTGHQGMWPLALATDLRYRVSPERLEQQLGLLPDVASQIDARYLVWTDNDYFFAPPMKERLAKWAGSFCEVMRTEGGRERIYDLECIVEAQDHTPTNM